MATSKTATKPARTRARPGTYFLSLTVENVRCFGPAQTLDLSDGDGRYAHWTVILGENGVGKTTLLTGLATITMAGPPFGDSSDLEAENRRTYRWMLGLPNLRRNSTDRGGFRGVVAVSNRSGESRELEVRSEGPSVQVIGHMLAREIFCLKYGASRHMPQRGGFAEYDENDPTFLDDDVALRDPEDWFLRADYNARLRRSHARKFENFARRVQQALVSVLPDVTDIRIEASDELSGSPRVEARTPYGWVALRRLGFGYQSQIAWLVDFASRMFERYPDSPDPLAEPAVVLVDEIDLHMHPRWQRQVIDHLSKLCPATQFIVTAHSPLVVQAAADANIVLLRREGDHVVIDNDPEVLRNWRVDQILTSELFGLDSARPPQIEAQVKERRALLAKPKLTSRDRGRLAKLEAEIGDLPAGESAEDRRAMQLIRRAAEKLQSNA